MPEWIDLRSDTVTKPTLEMRRAMAEAEVGDDVYGEDPTVNRLEQRAAEIFQREAALFVPTGSMGNLICLRIHCDHGNEVICESRGHIFNFEMASMTAIAGCLPRPVETADGVLTWKHVEPAIRPKVYYRAQTGLISLENTHNIAGGRVLPPAVQDEICDRAHERGIPVHLEAAPISNAATFLRRSVADITRKVDSIMFCLSKGLGAPVGSMVVGSRAFIEKARVFRKMFGGGMGQVGVLAAAGPGAAGKPPAAPRPRPRQGRAPGRGAGRDSRYAPPAERRADEHPGLRRSRHRHERPGAFRQAQGTRGAGERGRPEADADGDALRRERRRDRARHPRRAGDLRRRAQELSAEFGLPNPGSILGMIEILVLRAGE